MRDRPQSLSVCSLNTGFQDVVCVLVPRTLGTLVSEQQDMWLLSVGGGCGGFFNFISVCSSQEVSNLTNHSKIM